MAFADILPGSFSMTPTKGVKQKFLSPVINSRGGTPVDFTTWNNVTCYLCPTAESPIGTDAIVGTTTGNSDGTFANLMGDTDLASFPVGTYKLVVTGQPTSGDAPELVALGTVTIGSGISR